MSSSWITHTKDQDLKKHRKKEQLYLELQHKGYATEYLLLMGTLLTVEDMNGLHAQQDAKEAELKIITTTSLDDLWMQDLDAFNVGFVFLRKISVFL